MYAIEWQLQISITDDHRAGHSPHCKHNIIVFITYAYKYIIGLFATVATGLTCRNNEMNTNSGHVDHQWWQYQAPVVAFIWTTLEQAIQGRVSPQFGNGCTKWPTHKRIILHWNIGLSLSRAWRHCVDALREWQMKRSPEINTKCYWIHSNLLPAGISGDSADITNELQYFLEIASDFPAHKFVDFPVAQIESTYFLMSTEIYRDDNSSRLFG